MTTFVCAALLTAGCGANPNGPDVSFPVTLNLKVGQTASAGGLDVTFTEVSYDWRCPINAACISAGDAYLQFQLSANHRTQNYQLQVEHPDNRAGSFEGYRIEVKSLAPLPDTSRLMDKGEYKVTLMVSR
ncbi:MAG: hypothetical protein EPO35_10195 [Acidobacteria bacterium]|nr:MAG: hypothetical protein EPO35_10195 [Acidobacteriota bacterium]